MAPIPAWTAGASFNAQRISKQGARSTVRESLKAKGRDILAELTLTAPPSDGRARAKQGSNKLNAKNGGAVFSKDDLTGWEPPPQAPPTDLKEDPYRPSKDFVATPVLTRAMLTSRAIGPMLPAAPVAPVAPDMPPPTRLSGSTCVQAKSVQCETRQEVDKPLVPEVDKPLKVNNGLVPEVDKPLKVNPMTSLSSQDEAELAQECSSFDPTEPVKKAPLFAEHEVRFSADLFDQRRPLKKAVKDFLLQEPPQVLSESFFE